MYFYLVMLGAAICCYLVMYVSYLKSKMSKQNQYYLKKRISKFILADYVMVGLTALIAYLSTQAECLTSEEMIYGVIAGLCLADVIKYFKLQQLLPILGWLSVPVLLSLYVFFAWKWPLMVLFALVIITLWFEIWKLYSREK